MRFKSPLPFVIATILFFLRGTPGAAEDWGVYRIVSASASEFVLEAVGGAKEGTVVSIQKPNAAANQKWVVLPGDVAKDDGSVKIAAAQDQSLVLTVEKGSKNNGSLIVLEKDRGEAFQRWVLKKTESGAYSLIAKHAPEQGLDHFGGVREAGTRIDLWTYSANDAHLQWFIRPMADRKSTRLNSSHRT